MFLVEVFPRDRYVTVPNGQARFTCNTQLVLSGDSRRATGVEWLLNSTALQNFNHHNTIIRPVFYSDIGIGVLRFENVAVELNKTMGVCTVSFSSGSPVISNGASLLIIMELTGRCIVVSAILEIT